MAPNPHPGHDYYVDTLNGDIQRGYTAATIRFLGRPMAGPFDWAHAVESANNSILNKAVKPAKAAAGSIADVGDFFHRLTEASTWTRVAEVGVGGLLLYAGLRALAHGSSANVAGKAAAQPVRKVTKTAAKVVMPEARLATRVTAKRVAPRVTAHRAQARKYGAKRRYGP